MGFLFQVPPQSAVPSFIPLSLISIPAWVPPQSHGYYFYYRTIIIQCISTFTYCSGDEMECLNLISLDGFFHAPLFIENTLGATTILYNSEKIPIPTHHLSYSVTDFWEAAGKSGDSLNPWFIVGNTIGDAFDNDLGLFGNRSLSKHTVTMNGNNFNWMKESSFRASLTRF